MPYGHISWIDQASNADGGRVRCDDNGTEYHFPADVTIAGGELADLSPETAVLFNLEANEVSKLEIL